MKMSKSGAIWRLTTSERDQWFVEEISKLQVALDELWLRRVRLPSYSYAQAEDLLDQLRGQFLDNNEDSESD
jgi:hypothetical protein